MKKPEYLSDVTGMVARMSPQLQYVVPQDLCPLDDHPSPLLFAGKPRVLPHYGTESNSYLCPPWIDSENISCLISKFFGLKDSGKRMNYASGHRFLMKKCTSQNFTSRQLLR